MLAFYKYISYMGLFVGSVGIFQTLGSISDSQAFSSASIFAMVFICSILFIRKHWNVKG